MLFELLEKYVKELNEDSMCYPSKELQEAILDVDVDVLMVMERGETAYPYYLARAGSGLFEDVRDALALLVVRFKDEKLGICAGMLLRSMCRKVSLNALVIRTVMDE